MIEKVYTTVYYVDDWDASVAFYRNVLGLKPLPSGNVIGLYEPR